MDNQVLVSIHSTIRWLVLLTAIVAVGAALVGWWSGAVSPKTGRLTMLIYTTVLDIQVLIGIIVWVQGNFGQFGEGLSRLEHPITMIVALLIAHVTAARARRGREPVAARTRAIGGAVSLLVILLGLTRIGR